MVALPLLNRTEYQLSQNLSQPNSDNFEFKLIFQATTKTNGLGSEAAGAGGPMTRPLE